MFYAVELVFANNGHLNETIRQSSVSLEKFTFPERCVLVLGREKEGIPTELLQIIDVCVEIPQLGIIRSLNVHVSASIMLFDYTRQRLLKK